MDTTYHKPVLINEVLEALDIKPGKTYLDVTFGGGGHSRAILESDPTVKVIGMDWDLNAIDNAESIIDEYPDRLRLIWGNFGHLYKLIKKHKIENVDGILADFGTSQFQIHERDGFSLYNDTPLDMRMSVSHFKTTAADIINHGTERELCEILWDYGEERHAKKIVYRIIEARSKKRIRTTFELAEIVKRAVGGRPVGNIHPATRVFQALRIFINSELEQIKLFLPIALNLVKPGGRVACISFHSLEDRIVKQFFRVEADKGHGELVSRKAISASDEELAVNPSARSAKLRIFEKKQG
jgi:16S rRNA (cytosine1402-N4)-methyltransferase